MDQDGLYGGSCSGDEEVLRGGEPVAHPIDIPTPDVDDDDVILTPKTNPASSSSNAVPAVTSGSAQSTPAANDFTVHMNQVLESRLRRHLEGEDISLGSRQS